MVPCRPTPGLPGVLPNRSSTANRRPYAVGPAEVAGLGAGVLGVTVRMENDAGWRGTVNDRHAQRIDDQIGAHVAGQREAEHLAGVLHLCHKQGDGSGLMSTRGQPSTACGWSGWSGAYALNGLRSNAGTQNRLNSVIGPGVAVRHWHQGGAYVGSARLLPTFPELAHVASPWSGLSGRCRLRDRRGPVMMGRSPTMARPGAR